MEYHLPYGFKTLTIRIPDEISVDLVEAPHTPADSEPTGLVRAALNNLLDGLAWQDFGKPRSVGIAVNDKTRPVPHDILLPPLLERLAEEGIPAEAVNFFVAVGTHPPMQPSGFSAILPEAMLQKYRVVSHDSDTSQDLVYLGVTSQGTPIWTNQAYMQSDLKIVVGNLEPHQFAGFSGGYKTAAIGLAGRTTINRNHALLMHPDSMLGQYETNPMRQDIEKIGQAVGVHLALNAILNQKREIVHVLAGHPLAVMRAGIPHARRASQAAVSQKYSLVIASPGGHPKDINVYQSQKGLMHAALVTRTGGTLLLVAACPEGAGSPHYQDWMTGKSSQQEVIRQFGMEGFRVGPHKAYLIAREATRLNLGFFTEMEASQARQLLLQPIPNLQTAVDAAVQNLGPGERVGLIPHAATTIPYLVDE